MAESALDTCDWDPRRAFLFARDLAIAVKKTRHLASQAVSHPSFSNQRFPIDAVTLVYDKVSDLFLLNKTEHENFAWRLFIVSIFDPPEKRG